MPYGAVMKVVSSVIYLSKTDNLILSTTEENSDRMLIL